MKYINLKLGIFLILGFLVALFNNLIIDKYNNKIVDPLLSKVISNYACDILFVLLVSFAVLLCFKFNNTQKSVKGEYLVMFIMIGTTYVIFKYSGKYIYTPLKLSHYFYYTDVFELPLLAAIIYLNHWRQKKAEPTDNKVPFLMDTPLNDSKEEYNDQFGYSKFAKQLALKLQSKLEKQDCGSLAIGIMGEWGAGKTSFINLIKKEIDRNNRIVIDFYPWRSSKKKNIIEDFFELLISELSHLDTRLGSNLISYANSLAEIDENTITKGLRTLSEYVLGSQNKNVNYSLINGVLTKSKTQILIFIDDLDRLDKREIIEVLRIIRNTASFNNIVYIVGYDRGYIEEAIKEINPHKHESYLEKIFQFELLLPYIDPETIRFNVQKMLIDKVDSLTLDELKKVIYLKFGGERYYVNEIMRNQRDVIRFTNNLLFDFEFVKGEVHPKDLFLFQLIKFQFPAIYESLRINRFLYFTISEEYLGRPILRLRKIGEEDYPDGLISTLKGLNEPGKEDEGKEKTIFSHDISLESKFNRNEKKLIIAIVNEIVSKKDGLNEMEYQMYNSFIFPNNFNNYFKLALGEMAIPTEEFEIVRKQSFETYTKAVDTWIDENKYPQIIDKLSNISKFKSKTEVNNHLDILWKLGSKFYLFGNSEKYPIFLVYKAFQNAWDHINLFDNKLELHDRILGLLSNERINIFFAVEATFLFLVDKDKFILTKDELKDINFKYFERTCKSPQIDNYFYAIYERCILFDPKNTSDYYTMNPDAKKLFIQHIKENISICQLGRIIKQTNRNPDEFQIDERQLTKHFGSYSEFIEHIKESPGIDRQSKCYAELNDFLDALQYIEKKNNAIEFKFQNLEVIKWIEM